MKFPYGSNTRGLLLYEGDISSMSPAITVTD
jgi:hypothetical protein